MATNIRYYPPGFIGTEDAILRIAKARYPDRWLATSMSQAEAAVWNGINKTFSGLVLDPHLPISIPKDEKQAAFKRYQDFIEAMTELRKALHVGSVIATFCDEAGKFDTIQSAGWGGDAAIEIMLTGVATLDYGDHTYTRLVLLAEAGIQRLISPAGETEVMMENVAVTEGQRRSTSERPSDQSSPRPVSNPAPSSTSRRGEKRRNIRAALRAEFGDELGRRKRDMGRAQNAVAAWHRRNAGSRLPAEANWQRMIYHIWNS